MGKYASIVIGAAVTLIGVAGLTCWWSDFLTVLKGSIPVMLIFGGVIAVIAGISELKDQVASKK